MTTIVTQPTSTALWHSLILDAEQACKHPLDTEMQSYLVFLLMRFTQDHGFAAKILAMEFMQGMQATGQAKQVKLRDVADSCLLTTGLFPQQAQRRRVSLSYYMDLGRSAYLQLALAGSTAMAAVYQQLAKHFVALMDILQAVREFGGKQAIGLPLDLHALWQSGSQRAREHLSVLIHPESIPVATQSKVLH